MSEYYDLLMRRAVAAGRDPQELITIAAALRSVEPDAHPLALLTEAAQYGSIAGMHARLARTNADTLLAPRLRAALAVLP